MRFVIALIKLQIRNGGFREEEGLIRHNGTKPNGSKEIKQQDTKKTNTKLNKTKHKIKELYVT